MSAMWLTASCLLLLPVEAAVSGEMPAYRLFRSDGTPATWAEAVEAAAQADVVLFGEEHHNPICHWLELELARALHERHGKRLLLGAEMFETDDQLVLDEFLNGTVRAVDLEREAKVWTNYATDYQPLIEFARDKRLRVVATNIPRRYANLVARSGLDALDKLSDAAKAVIAPLPMAVDLTLPGYRAIAESTHPHPNGSMTRERMAQAQAVKDATMAWSILRHLQPGETLLHFNGAYHSAYDEGIVWHLRQARPALRITTLGTVEQEDLETLDPDSQGFADFILVTPTRLTHTH